MPQRTDPSQALSRSLSRFARLPRWLVRPRLNFISIHYGWIIFCTLLAFPVMHPYGNLDAVDSLFFGCSGSTESGLNTVDVKDLALYQQIFLYVIPVVTNLMFVNAMVVPVRLYWFRQRLRQAGIDYARRQEDEENQADAEPPKPADNQDDTAPVAPNPLADAATPPEDNTQVQGPPPRASNTITFDEKAHPHPAAGAGNARPTETDGDSIRPVSRRRTQTSERSSAGYAAAAKSLHRVTSSVFVLGKSQDRTRRARSRSREEPARLDLPRLSRQATAGRNSRFRNLTEMDRELLGGVEYLALKMLLKFVFGYFFGLHLLGVICLLPWIHAAPSKYTDWLAENAISKTWWAFYSAQTMTNNLGFTLTPDSMASFRDATWPMLIMTLLAFAGNTLYPVLLRLCVWTAYKLAPRRSQAKDTLHFLLHHPRRCYTLLFPSKPTWVLLAIVVALNVVDVILIVALDLDNPAVNQLPMGPRILSALFQAASARHTGTSTIDLSRVSPAVQFSLLTMMYIAVFPIAMSIRSSNTYEERTISLWGSEGALDEGNGRHYLLVHIQNQLTFDLWYIFLGTFLICIAESGRIMDLSDSSFNVFSILFEVTSGYGNVGLSLGGPSGSTSMSGHFTTFSKVVMCFMMIRGRHRGLPYGLDRAVVLPGDITADSSASSVHDAKSDRDEGGVDDNCDSQRNKAQ